jgi:carboxyl-terminal processing protease
MDEQKIARFVATLLERLHFRRQRLDDTLSSRFLDEYLDDLDPSRLYFTQEDLAEFEKWRLKLDELTRDEGDTRPAIAIFQRLLQRVDQEKEHVLGLLKSSPMTFTADEEYRADRKSAVRPKDLDEAKSLWEARLRHQYLQEKLTGARPEEVEKTISRRYERVSRNLHQYDGEEIFQLYLSSLSHVFDPHTDYMGRSSFEDFGIRMKLSLFGIGATLASEDGYCTIKELTPGGPAARSNELKPGDRIVAVAQGAQEPVDVIDMKLTRVVDMIRGPKDTEVRLTVIPADAMDAATRKVVILKRDEIRLEGQEAHAVVVDAPAGKGTVRIGLIDLPSFYADTEGDGPARKSATRDVAALLEKLQKEKVEGLVLDLRRNGGGSLDEAIRLTGLFIKAGPVVQSKGPDGRVEIESDPDPAIQYAGPLVVLTSHHSASASEILAGALQDYGRAVIVGASATHGKGTVQTLLQLGPVMRRSGIETLADPGALKLTIRKFYRPSGASTQLRGVNPDIIVPSLDDGVDAGERSLRNALPWDAIPKAPFTPLGQVDRHRAELVRRSRERMQKDPDFAWIRAESARLASILKSPTISLNEAKRRKDREENQARAEARKKELAARPAPTNKMYVISVRRAAQPGLPAPTVGALTASMGSSLLEGDGPDDAKRVGVDVQLAEAKQVLLDLVQLSKPARTAAAGH